MSKNLLVVEDQKDIANLVRINLEMLGHKVTLCHTGEDAYTALKANTFDLLVLDLNLPDMDGLDICKSLRNKENAVPILMLTARTAELDRVEGLEVGADDYLTKPFSVLELQARVKALLRRSQLSNQTPETSKLQIGNLRIDIEGHKVWRDDEEIELTGTEFDLLVHLAKHPGRVYSREQLLSDVWGYHHDCYEHTVNSHMNRLRSKLEPDPANPSYIKTVWGVGYKFEEPK